MEALNLLPFRSISLEEMSAVKLMNRVDTKYVTTVDRLIQLLNLLADEYFIQDADGVRKFPYYTVYFDTPDCHMYMMHHTGKKKRVKIRMRTYKNSGQNFLEIKKKNNKGRTRKKRIGIDEIVPTTVPYTGFISSHSNFDSEHLCRQIENSFDRITLVNQGFTERLTIDTNLHFHNLANDNHYRLPNLAIIELKRDGMYQSPVVKHLQSLRIKPCGFSKYCMGMAFTNPSLRQNRFKERVRLIQKLNNQSSQLTPTN